MSQLRFTEKAILKLPAPDPSGVQVIYWDTTLRGFGVQCSGISTSKSYIAQRAMPGGKVRRIKVGSVSELSLIEANQLAAGILIDLRKGVDLDAKAKSNMTLRTALEEYLAARRDLSPASVRVYKQIERTLAPWLDWPLRNITADMVEKKHREIADRIGKNGTKYAGKSTANGAFRTLKVLWNFAADRVADMPPNPVRRLKRQWFAEPRRTRMIPPERMPEFYRAVRMLDNAVTRDFLLLLMFTGLRKGEASSLRWADINLPQRTITLPPEKTKAKRELVLPMSDVVFEMLVKRRALGDATYVFPGSGRHGHMVDLALPLEAIKKRTGIIFSAHDLRRGFATIGESLDVSMTTLKALLNHAPARDVTSRYVVLSPERLQQPVQRIADKIKELCGIMPPAGANVSQFKRGKVREAMPA
jgi:integrase